MVMFYGQRCVNKENNAAMISHFDANQFHRILTDRNSILFLIYFRTDWHNFRVRLITGQSFDANSNAMLHMVPWLTIVGLYERFVAEVPWYTDPHLQSFKQCGLDFWAAQAFAPRVVPLTNQRPICCPRHDKLTRVLLSKNYDLIATAIRATWGWRLLWLAGQKCVCLKWWWYGILIGRFWTRYVITLFSCE